MTQRMTITPVLPEIREIFRRCFPAIVRMSKESESIAVFKKSLANYVNEYGIDDKGKEALFLLIDNDDTVVDELSTSDRLNINTIGYLWKFLRDEPAGDVLSDVYIDLFHQLYRLFHEVSIRQDSSLVKRQMSRWPSGLDEDVMAIREENKRRIINALVRKIERWHASSVYQFEPDMAEDEKYLRVNQWWDSSRFHLTLAIKNPVELNLFLGNTLSEETMRILARARKKGMPFFVTPYYLSLLNTGKGGYDDQAIRSYILYSDELVDTYGAIKAWEKEDIVVDGEPNAAGWLLPEGRNIHRRYPEVSILIPDSMGRACGGLCASCQRMYDFQSKRLNFDFEALKPKETWEKKLRRLMAYFVEDTQLRDILITGGDALMSQNATLKKILDAVCKMAIYKRKANESRPDGEKYAEIQRIRLGTRLPAYLPLRITDELVRILREFKEKALQIGICQFYIQTHFQSPLEITPEAKRAIEAILSAGWTITNQLVFNVAASRKGHTAKLRQALNSVGVMCYYTFSVKGFRENYAVFVPNSRSLQEAKEEKVVGIVPRDKQAELCGIIRHQRPLGKKLLGFLKENRLPFAGTDRNVLNLPGIGKSMSFRMVGLTSEGKRILRFDHDASRRHSPIINRMKQVYIVENKSVAAYLKQLQDMGEDLNEYQTIWYYTEGETEPRFNLYEYPAYSFGITERMSNLRLQNK